MSARRRSLAERVYRAMLALYPRAFREQFGDEMADFVRDRVRAQARDGDGAAVARAWARAYADLMVSATAERIAHAWRALVACGHLLRDAVRPDPDERYSDMIGTLLQDLRFALRAMLARRAFSAVVLATLALGIGANTAIFSVVRGVLLRALPYAEPDRIVHLKHLPSYETVSEPEFVDYRDGAKSLAKVAAYSSVAINLTGDAEPEKVTLTRVSDGFFSILGARLTLGRAFTPDEDRRGAPRVVMISHGLWERRYASNPKLVGTTIQLNGTPVTVVGVLPPHFDYPTPETAVWVPLRLNYDTLWTRNNHYLQLIARLAPGATFEGMRAELATLAQRWQRAYPETYGANAPLVADVALIRDSVLGKTRPYLLALLGAVGFVLLIACVNVANLLLARGEARRKEVAIRTALGASRGRIIRQALTESAVYAFLGAACGLPIAWWGWRALRALAPATIPRLDEVRLDGTVFAFTLGCAIATGLLFGLVPALRAAGADAGESLKAGGKTSSQARGLRRARGALVISEVALAVVMLTGAGLMVRSLLRLQSVDLGMRTTGVLSLQVAPTPRDYQGDRPIVFYRDLLTRIRALPGVRAAGAVGDLPVADGYSEWSILIDGQAMTSVAQSPAATPEQVTPGYFETLGIGLVRGRTFTDDDRADAPLVMVVNEAMVRKHWPSVDPIGHTVKMLNNASPWATVVGVVRDVRHNGYQEGEPPPTMYFPHAQAGKSAYYTPIPMSLVVRTDGDAASLAAPIRAVLRAIDPKVPVARVQSMTEVVDGSVASRRFSTQLLILFAALALALAAIGIYGVISYSVSQRAFEIALRMALGAQRAQVLGLVVREGMGLAIAGLAAGLVGSLALLRLARSMLVDVSIADPITWVIVSVTLALVAALASYLPARRAIALELTAALRG